MIDLTDEQERELREYADGRPRQRVLGHPNRNLIRRNLLTLHPASGHGYYRITEAGRAALAERDARPPITWPDLFALLREGLARTKGEEFDAWVEREGFEVEALVRATRFLAETGRESGEPLEALLLGAFAAGWDAHRDLRGETPA